MLDVIIIGEDDEFNVIRVVIIGRVVGRQVQVTDGDVVGETVIGRLVSGRGIRRMCR